MLKKITLILSLIINFSYLFSQTELTIEGNIIVNTVTGEWLGHNIPRSVKTAFTYRNNSITSVNSSGYMLQAGDEGLSSSNNNLDGEIITGNKFIWNGTDWTSITHAVFTGYNINAIIKYNYLYKTPFGMLRKSNGMTNTSGGVAYNIFNKGMIAVVAKGINGVLIYNNTFYSDRTFANTNYGRPLVDIYSNTDNDLNVPSTGTKIKNNIFYTKYQINNIRIFDAGCLAGFESDYNVYYCEAGKPMFQYLNEQLTFAEWQALGYDKHSVVINPGFINITDFVPTVPLYYGTDLGTTWKAGLSTTAEWKAGSSPATTNQDSKWQVGARIYDVNSINTFYKSSVIENIAPTILEISYSLSLANILPAASAFNVQVNSVSRVVSSVAIVAGKVRLTLASSVEYGDIVTVAYTKPARNPLQTTSGGEAVSVSSQPVVNNCTSNIPVYSASVVENATPTSLEIRYNLNLSNIVPPVSAFSVLVNSVARGVNSVSISANKVRLTLASEINFGDIVTVSYTKPANNQIQIATGGQATSFSAKLIVNNISPPSTDPTAAKIRMTIYPNPVHRIVSITFEYSGTFSITDPARSPQIIRIFDISGKLSFEKLLVTGITKVRFQINFRPGIYTVLVLSHNQVMSSQKMLVY